MTYLEPALPLLLLAGIVGVVRSWRSSKDRRRPWLEAISIVGLWLLSIEAGAWALSRPLEMWYSQEALPSAHAEAIVVLAGAVHPPVPNRPYPLPGQDTYRRVQHAAWLFRTWKPLPILVSGGGRGRVPLSETMRELLLAQQVPADRIWTEERSTNTRESAVYGAEILRAHRVTRVALIVEANGMPRAQRAFERMGITVLPVPVRYIRRPARVSDFLPGWSAIAANGETIHEMGGLMWYKLRGWI